ncbi:MAG: D-sedoheptulose 7-phosphate isomerase [Bacteroidota bacterium]
MKKNIEHIISESIAVKSSILDDETLLNTIESIVHVITNSFQSGFKVQFCGNGGSAADAQHLAAEFSGRFYKNRKALPSDALHCNSSYLTAVANDYSYDEIYARLVEGTMVKGDVLIGLTTSGNSENIVKAFEVAKAKEIITIGFTGSTGGKLKALSDYLINIPSNITPRIQESHILIGHVICELVEEAIFPG